MKKSARVVRKSEIRAAARAHGWTLDRWGNLKKTFDDGILRRIKLNPLRARYERQVTFSDGRNEWVLVGSIAYDKQFGFETREA